MLSVDAIGVNFAGELQAVLGDKRLWLEQVKNVWGERIVPVFVEIVQNAE